MFYKIEISNLAYKDILDLTTYIYEISYSYSIAKKIYDNLYQAIFSLEFMPYRFEKYIWEYRRLIVDWKYKIIYRIEEKKRKEYPSSSQFPMKFFHGETVWSFWGMPLK